VSFIRLDRRESSPDPGSHPDDGLADRPRRDYRHPTQKPVALISRVLRNSTVRGEVALDPFAGSGTTLIACEQLGRRCLSMEIEPKYCDVIVQRWENYTGKKARILRDEVTQEEVQTNE
jgi:DNA modification methylase